MPSKYYKENKTDRIWWLRNEDATGVLVFSFDKKTNYILFQDYPNKLTKKQKELFDKENPYWADFFSGKE